MSTEFVNISATVIDSTDAANAKRGYKLVDFKKINVDWDRNPRMASAYGKDKIEWMARSLFDNGLREPVTVSLRADGTYWLLKGHIRLSGMIIVRTIGLDATKASGDTAAKPAVPPQPNFMDKVPCVVLEGLSPVAELDILMDHGDTTKLSPREIYRAIKGMAMTGFTQQFIADRLKMSRPAVSKKIWVAAMPPCVEAAFMSDDKDAPDLNEVTIGQLYTAYTEDHTKDANLRLKVGGPLFNAAWEKFVSEGKSPRFTAYSTKDLRELAGFHTDLDIQDLLVGLSKGKKEGGTDVANALSRLKLRLVPFGDIAPEVPPQDNGPMRTVVSEGIETPVVG